MRAVDAQGRLEELLAVRGVALTDIGRARQGAGADVRQVWEAFGAAAGEAVDPRFELDGRALTVPDDCDCDLLLFESGWGSARPAAGGGWAPDGIEPTVYHLHFTRQFTFQEEDGEYAGMHALTLTVECEGSPGSFTATEECWGYGGPGRDDISDEHHPEMDDWAGQARTWVARVESSDGFGAFEALVPQRFFVEQGPI